MNYITVYVGMDVHKDSFTLSCFTNEKEVAEYTQKVKAHYSKVLNYLEAMRFHYGDDALFICGYEAGCLGYSLYHDLVQHNVKCVILAPSTMARPADRKVKTDRLDAELIARCLAHRDYKSVYVPSEQDEQVKEYLRMRDDHKTSLKKIKQQILAFCLRHNLRHEGHNWTQVHLKWLRNLELPDLYRELLSEYLSTYDMLTRKIERFDSKIQEIASGEAYHDKVKKLGCFLGIKTHTAMAIIVETGDFSRFNNAGQYASYLGLVPRESSSAEDKHRFGITKAGNRHIRTLLVEASQSFARGKIGYKSKELNLRQQGNSPEVITYADHANERLRRKYYNLVLHKNKKVNVAKTAVARELACFIWGMMTDHLN